MLRFCLIYDEAVLGHPSLFRQGDNAISKYFAITHLNPPQLMPIPSLAPLCGRVIRMPNNLFNGNLSFGKLDVILSTILALASLVLIRIKTNCGFEFSA
jgi:hypothetical protein